MLPDYEIVLGQGIGFIQFGMTKKEFMGILGDPDDIEHPDDIERAELETYRYNSINCSFSFETDHEERLVEIIVENGYFHILHKIRVGLSKKDLLNLGVEFKFGDPVVEEMRNEEFPERELIYYSQAGLKLWLDDEKISVIQISPLIGKTY